MNIKDTLIQVSKKKKRCLIKVFIVLLVLISFIMTPFYFNYYFDKENSLNSLETVESHLFTSNVISGDDRIRVTPTTSFPWSTIIKLYITWGSYNTFGTGVMIDKNHVLTAGHSVYSHSRGGWADNVRVVPGADNGNEPYGHAWAINMRSYSRWITNADEEHDMALITLDRDIGLQTGWMELFTSVFSNSIYSGILNTAGYPYDLDNGNNMYRTSESGGYSSEYNHFFYLDVEGGQSGSPIWLYDGTNRYVTSIVTASWVGLDINYGTRINRNKFDCIMNWITADETSTNKPDLRSESNSFAGFNPTLGGSGFTKLDIWCKIINIGTINSNTFTISYYASPDTTFSNEDYLIGTDQVTNLSPTDSINSQWSGIIPESIPSGEYYIGWILDVSNTIDEFNENNNWNFIWDYKLVIDATPPVNPTFINQTNGVTQNNVWQSNIKNPAFNWANLSNSQIDVDGYYYYWGTEPNGRSSHYTKLAQYNPPPVNSGIYYMRVCARDILGNNASWTTLYVFKYDGTAPINPSTCDQLFYLTESDVWQNIVDKPFFMWEESSDSHSGLDGYYYYWGTEQDGISNSFSKINKFNPPTVNNGTYYLRISAKDNVGNMAPWTTLYIFKFNGNIGDNEEVYEEDFERSFDFSNFLISVLYFGLAVVIAVFSVLLIYQFINRLRN